MRAFIVRLIDSGELVGFYCTGNIDGLWHHIDEWLNPFECEYSEIADFGFGWPAPNTGNFVKYDNPDPDELCGTGDYNLDGCTPTETTGQYFWNMENEQLEFSRFTRNPYDDPDPEE